MVARAAKAENMTAEVVEAAIRGHFDGTSHAVVTGVRNDAGWAATRTCDVLVIGTWPSTGHIIHGLEIKVSRGDWLREIQDPTKAEAFARFCDYWWIAASPGIVKLEELPAAWGLFEVVGKGLRARRPASKREAPEQITRAFLSCIARRVVEQCPAEALVAAAEKRGRDAACAEYASRETEREKRRQDWKTSPEEETAKALLDRFEAATGVRIESWNADETAAHFKRFVEAKEPIGSLRHLLESVQRRATEGLAALGAEASA